MNDEDIDFANGKVDNNSNIRSPKKVFKKLARELKPDELSSSGVHKLLLAEIDRLQHQEDKFEEHRSLLVKADKEVAVLTEKNHKSSSYEVLYSAGLAIGSLFIGFAPSLASPFTIIVPLGGAILIVIAVMAKHKQK